MTSLRRVCVFCGSQRGTRAAYAHAAREFGTALARRGLGLVYGGGNVGLMGEMADAALAAGGHVTGVIPYGLVVREVAHAGLSEQRVVRSMHERKATMAELSDAFVALPGGFGTFEELFEVVTWAQLGLHAKPIVVLDIEHFFTPLFTLLDHAVDEGFLRRENRRLIQRAETLTQLFATLERHEPAPVEQWIDRATS